MQQALSSPGIQNTLLLPECDTTYNYGTLQSLVSSTPKHVIVPTASDEEYYSGLEYAYRFDSDSELSDDELGAELGDVEYPDLVSDLRVWTIENNVSHSQLSALLKVLRKQKGFQSLPVDSRTVMQTPRLSTAQICSPGKYVHFGFSNILTRLQQSLPDLNVTDLVWQLNIDGIPLTKSSSTQFWPILAYPANTSVSPVPVGIYCGSKKPESSNEFLSPLVSEILELNIKVQLFCCDAPARSYISGVKGHNAFSGCSKCKQVGKTVQNRVTFSTNRGEIRTNESFRSFEDEDHHNYKTILTDLKDLDMTGDFVYEYMHLVCLGVTKKLIILWMRGSHRIFKLSAVQVNMISNKLLSMKPFVCTEFNRKPRPLQEIDRWKATELRQFLLYSGPIATKEVLPADHFNLFMCLFVAIRILVSPNLFSSMNQYAESLLDYFVSAFPKLYGEHFVSYNVHGLLHLASDSKKFGPLDTFSAFRFENQLGKLKRMVRSSNNQLSQIERRLYEMQSVTLDSHSKPSSSINHTGQHEKGPLLADLTSPQFKIVEFSNFKLVCNSDTNSYCLTKSGKFLKILNSCYSNAKMCQVLIAIHFRRKESLFMFPCDSKLIGVFVADTGSSESSFLTVEPSDLLVKCQVFPHGQNQLAVFPIIHCEV